jgi:iron uptake system component EfeO
LDGTAGLAFEIGSEKAEGGESPYSDTSLTDMQNNMVGIEAAYALAFARDLEAADPALHREVTALLIALTEELDIPDLVALDQPALLRLSEKLAIALQDAAGPLRLETPKLGG